MCGVSEPRSKRPMVSGGGGTLLIAICAAVSFSTSSVMEVSISSSLASSLIFSIVFTELLSSFLTLPLSPLSLCRELEVILS